MAKKPSGSKRPPKKSAAKKKSKTQRMPSLRAPADTLWLMYRKMSEIRLFEEQVWDVYTRGLMPGLAHLYIGEEAVAVGTCTALRDDDYITSTHRGHGHCLAKGGQLDRMMAEIMGKEAGYCRGKGGSMHIADMSVGILGANGIVGGGFGIATGAALSSKLRDSDQVSVCFFGDGASNQGIMLETVNMAAAWDLPAIYICENNQYGEHTPYQAVTGVEDIADRAKGLGLEGVIVDGSDVLAMFDSVNQAVDKARTGGGPTLIEAKTYRFHGHHVGDAQTYRAPDEVKNLRESRDCLMQFRNKTTRAGLLTAAQLDAIDARVEDLIEDAVRRAKSDPKPQPADLLTDVYVAYP